MKREQIYESLKQLLVELLGVDYEMIQDESSLIDDLGAESIDFVDLCYQLEKRFNIGEVKVSQIYPDVSDISYNADKVKDLVESYPYMNNIMLEKFKEEESFASINSFLALAEFVCWRVENNA